MLSANRTFKFLITFFCLWIPLNNSYEVFAMFNGELGYKSWAVHLTPLFIKILKDILLIFLVITSIFKLAKFKTKINFDIYLFILVLFLVIVSTQTFLTIFTDPLSAIIGLRSYWVLLLVFVGIVFYEFEADLYKPLSYVFLLHFVLQCFQLFFDIGFPVYAEYRNPGIFMIPSTAGAFALVYLYLSIQFKNKVFILLSVLSLFLSTSSMAAIIFCTYVTIVISKQFKERSIVFIIICIFSLPFTISMIFYLRGSALLYTTITRLEIIKENINLSNGLAFWGEGVGIASSQAKILNMNNVIVPDNTFLAVLINFGVIPCLLILLFVFLSVFHLPILLFLIVSGYSMVTILFEMNPVVHLLMLLLGMNYGKMYLGKSVVNKL